MRTVEYAVPAAIDIDEILAASEAEFGPLTAERYEKLIARAIDALASNPGRIGVRQNPDTPTDVRWFHLRAVRTVAPPGERIGRPRHLIVFTFNDTRLFIVRVLHDSMDIPARIG
ncbi:type II toxin-antitoxin system RelE/ParE family toxin [Brevundimonas staleyi]|uniref:Type II toxin-antitoxin system RelE/ParE family toxin n=1 Tax=Brevundimonas staleyi TaxID=74326 RepID=A0ABW0G0V2_9CAUL